MNYAQKGNAVILTDYNSFSIEETLECGQCFRFIKIAEREYIIIAHSKVLSILDKGNEVHFFPCDIDEFESIWINYFDLKRNYREIKEILCERDEVLQKASAYANGIRILNQQSYECLISFIISQNNRIPMIKQVIKNICEFYGEGIGDFNAFPEPEKLVNLSEAELRECKAGFRAKYILDATRKVCDRNGGFLKEVDEADTETARKILMNIKGVGPKVADCVLLFSFGRHEVFPTDVWIKRVVEQLYFSGEQLSIKEIQQFSSEKFGEYAGYAQQYLFHYARSEQIGK